MNEFEQFIASNYGIAAGDDVPDAVLAEASAAFRQAKSTVQSIDPRQNNFDLDASIPDAQPQPTMPPQSGAAASPENPLSGTPFDYKSARPILEELFLDTQLKEDLFKGSKFGSDKVGVVTSFDKKLSEYYEPKLKAAGVTLGRATAGVNAALKQGKSVDEAFGIIDGAPSADLARLEYSKKEAAGVLETLKNAGFEDNSPEVQRGRQNLQALQQQYERAIGATRKPEDRFLEAETNLKVIPTFASKQRPFQGRTDYENISAELQDERLAAGIEGLKSKNPMFVDVTSYSRTKDGKLTKSASEQFTKDVQNARKQFGQVVLFDGNDFRITGRGDGDPMETTSAEVAPNQNSTPVEGPDSAKAAAKALRDIGKATGMEDPPHIYAKKMYERYVGKPFTDAAWPWVSTFLRELKQPAGQ